MNVLIKPASGSCNMKCKYCFYEDEMKNRTIQNYGRMTLETLEAIVKRVMETKDKQISFAFQGGEPTLIGIEFYERLIHFVNKYNDQNADISYSIQTNGLLLDRNFVQFLKANNFLVGISLDGTEEIHDKNRIDQSGEGTFSRVMHAISLCKEYGVEYNVLTVVHNEVASNIGGIYNFYKRNGIHYQQYIECLEPFGEDGNADLWLDNKEYADFLIKLFRKWQADIKKGQYQYNRYFENLIMILKGYPPESCSMLGQCGKQWIIEADGSVFPCDFYVLDKWKLGNICTDTFEEMDGRREELGFVTVSKHIPEECASCKWYSLCRNGCRRNCEPVNKEVRSKNRFCSAYKDFFENVYEELVELANHMQ